MNPRKLQKNNPGSKKKFSFGSVIFTLLCTILSISFFGMLIAGLSDIRRSSVNPSFFTETDYARPVMEERYDHLLSIYSIDRGDDTVTVREKYRPLVQYYEASILHQAYLGAGYMEEADAASAKLDTLFTEHPEFQTDFLKIKEACATP